MSTLATLITKVQFKLDDDSFSAEEITKELNDGLRAVSREIKLPANDVMGEVTALATEISVAMPDDYQRGLYLCINKTTGRKISIVDSKGKLERMCGGLNNYCDISHVTVVGNRLFYQGQPKEDVELQLYYYAIPTLLEHDDDEPACIPEEYHKNLLVSYALGELYEDIEFGLEAATPNTDRYKAKFAYYLEKLREQTREGVSNRQPVTTGLDI